MASHTVALVIGVVSTVVIGQEVAAPPSAYLISPEPGELTEPPGEASVCFDDSERARLLDRVKELEGKLALHQEIRSVEIAITQGTPLSWSADTPPEHHPEQVLAALKATLETCPATAAYHFDLDCTEAPCLVWAEGSSKLPSESEPVAGSTDPFSLLAACPSWPYGTGAGSGSAIQQPDGTLTILTYDYLTSDDWPLPEDEVNIHKRMELRTRSRVDAFIESQVPASQ